MRAKLHKKASEIPLWKRYLMFYPWALRTEVANWEDHEDELLEIEYGCFNPNMQSDDDDLEGLVDAEDSLVMIVYLGDTAIGYLSAVPLESPSSSFDPETDPLLGYGDNDTLYLDSIAVLEEYRSPAVLQFLVVEYTSLVVAMNRFKHVSSHVRQSNGLAAFLMRTYGFKMLKKVENWYECNETFVYMHIKLSKMEYIEKKRLRYIRSIRGRLEGTWIEKLTFKLAEKLS